MPKIVFKDGSEIDLRFAMSVFAVSALVGGGASSLAKRVYEWTAPKHDIIDVEPIN